ncbi:MAG TPA: HisA/HisF-related TIM barrel protein [Pirellulales bacterium]|jgi:phosphoribosylformimino-5-aminoimidazole carboxamide ribotide isomerase|nr:HisA/HisF-related TIM barrel protein [Pirellulales bacterium]
MRVIPVLDLLGGCVVRGIAGRRSEYRPVRSALCRDAQPATVARALVEHFGFNQAYVADLDAIAGREPDRASYDAIAACGLQLWIDAGARAASTITASRMVVGSESIDGPEGVAELLAAVGPERFVFSLDLHDGGWFGTAAVWQGISPLDAACLAVEAGVERLMVLDLVRVGVAYGVGTETLCREIRELSPHIELIAGGGVRGPADLESLAAAGCDAALVASALHDGRLTRAEIEGV